MTTGSVLAQFTITLSPAVSEQVAVEWYTSDGTALAGVDYAASKGTVLFAPGETSKVVEILVYGRAVGAEDRSFFVEMLPPTNAILGASIGECIIHVDTIGSTPVTQIIVPTGPQGVDGKSAYQVWLDLGNTGTEQDFIDSLSPSPEEIAVEVAPLLNMGESPVTAEGTDSLSKPDTIKLKALARRVAYVGAAKIATMVLADGDNLIGQSDLTGDVISVSSPGLHPRIMRGTSIISPQWSVTTDGKLLIKSAVAGDVLYVCQYDVSSSRKINTNERELWRRSLAEAGFNLVDGSFEDGGTLSSAADVLWHHGAALAFGWEGGLPKTVNESSTPETSGGIGVGAWVQRTEIQLHNYAALRSYKGNLKSVYITGVIGTNGPEGIAGHFSLRSGDVTSADNGGTVIVDAVGRRWHRKYDGAINVLWFGDFDAAPDHRQMIQAALDVVADKGGELDFPPRAAGYTVKSEHPSRPGYALVLDITAKPDQYTRGGVSLRGYDWDSRVTLDTASNISALLYIPGSINYLRMKGMWFDANKKADYAFQASDDYNPFMGLEHCKFYRAKIACARISTFLSSFTGCFFGESDQDGLRLVGIGSGPVTSVTLTGCYAIRNARRGYDFGYLTYCTLNSCAADRNALAYYFNTASGVVMNGCGVETGGRALQVLAYRGFTLNGLYMLSVGSEDPLNPEPYLIEFGSGYGATVQGIRKESARYQRYLLGSTDSATGNDNITVLDGTVNRDTAYWVPSANFSRPIKFLRGDGTEKATTVNITTAQQLLDVATRYSAYAVDHDLIVNLADGDYDLTSLLTVFSNMKGSGTLYIRGNSATPTSVRINTNSNMLRFIDCSCRIYLKDLAIIGTVPNNSYKRITFTNCYNVVLDRVVVQRNAVNVGVGIENVNSRMRMINGAGVDTTTFGTAPMTVSAGGVVEIENLAADPANTGWFPGARYYLSNPVSGGPVGKVWVSAAAGWKGFGTVS